jgi:hypothetical protein
VSAVITYSIDKFFSLQKALCDFVNRLALIGNSAYNLVHIPHAERDESRDAGGFMPTSKRRLYVSGTLCLLLGIVLTAPGELFSSSKKVDENDATVRLFQLLDSAHSGKLDDIYVLADSYTDTGGDQYRHVLRIDYDKNRAFGRLAIYVRSVGKMTPEQLAAYKPEQIYEFGESDQEKLVKTDPGPFGQRGDLYLKADDDSPLHTTVVTDQVRKSYDTFLTQYVIPAVEKGQ